MKIIIFLLLFVILSKLAFASDKYFEFFPRNNVINSKNVVEIEVLFNLNNIFTQRFRIKPVSSSNFPEIWDDEKETWVFGNSLWSNMPKLNKNIKIKFNNPEFINTDVYFLVQDTITTEIYETSRQKIWSRNWFIEYLSKINEGLFKVLE